jgi:hypothetical protein
MLNSKVLTDDIFRREIKSLDRDEIALNQGLGSRAGTPRRALSAQA